MSLQRFPLSQALRVVFAIGWSDFVLKYRGSLLGYLWSLIGPLVKFGVILVVFGPFVEAKIPHYRLYLFLGIIIWEHFSITTSACMSMLHEKASIIQRLPFPRLLLIFAVGWTNLIVFMTHMAVFGMFCLYLGVHWTPHATYVAVTMIEMTLLSLGIGMILAAYSLRYRDVPHLWMMITQVLFWLTPIMYPPASDGAPVFSGAAAVLQSGHGSFGELFRLFINVQPLSVIMLDARRTLLYPQWGVPTLEHTAVALLLTGIVFCIGLFVFQRRQSSFVEEY